LNFVQYKDPTWPTPAAPANYNLPATIHPDPASFPAQDIKMKFAREFREAMANEGFPTRWVRHAVPYGELKKCLKKVKDAVPLLERLESEM
jgi:hypothetical protein